MILASRNDTSAPGIRPTGSLRIALGERCFRVPPFHNSLVGAPGQWGFARTGLPFGSNLVSAHAHRMPLRHSGRPVVEFGEANFDYPFTSLAYTFTDSGLCVYHGNLKRLDCIIHCSLWQFVIFHRSFELACMCTKVQSREI